MAELDLEALGTFTASGTNAQSYRIVVIAEAVGATVQALEKDPAAFDGAAVATTEVQDSGGKADFDLAPLKADIEQKTAGLAADAKLVSFVVGLPVGGGAAKAAAGPTLTLKRPAKDGKVELNPWVLRIIQEYPDHPSQQMYLWETILKHNTNGSAWCGNTRDVTYDGVTYRGHPRGAYSYCSGICFEVFMRAYELYCKEKGKPFKIGELTGATFETDVRRHFFLPGPPGRAGYPKGAAGVLTGAGIAIEVARDQAKPGDFAQGWSEPTGDGGHAVVFMGWSGGQLQFWSTQPNTNGTGRSSKTYHEVHIARVMVPE